MNFPSYSLLLTRTGKLQGENELVELRGNLKTMIALIMGGKEFIQALFDENRINLSSYERNKNDQRVIDT